MSILSDETALWLQLRKADPTAFETLYRHYWSPLFLYAYRILQDKEDAQDILQLFFTDVWENAAQLPVVSEVRPYLYRALKNRILNSIRDKHLTEQKVASFFQLSETDEDFSAETTEDATDKQEVLHLMTTLPGRMQQVLRLHYLENLSVHQIADQLGSAPQTIRNQLNIALKRMRSRLVTGWIMCLIYSFLQ